MARIVLAILKKRHVCYDRSQNDIISAQTSFYNNAKSLRGKTINPNMKSRLSVYVMLD
jgi:hypothetical protein